MDKEVKVIIEAEIKNEIKKNPQYFERKIKSTSTMKILEGIAIFNIVLYLIDAIVFLSTRERVYTEFLKYGISPALTCWVVVYFLKENEIKKYEKQILTLFKKKIIDSKWLYYLEQTPTSLYSFVDAIAYINQQKQQKI